jgi:nucleoid-associated protein YgaU
MEIKYNCPVCGKGGLPNFREDDVICPACETDLKDYRLLNEISEEQKNGKLSKIIFAILTFFLLLFSLLFFSQKQNQMETNAKHKEEIESLNNEIALLKENLSNNSENKEVGSSHFKYTVRRNDSFCLISQKMYGSQKYAKEIASANNKDLSNLLVIGEILIIPQK